MKLWNTEQDNLNDLIERFTIRKDRELDVELAPYDILGSIAHVIMLEEVGLLSTAESEALHKDLARLYPEAEAGKITIDEGVEDIHSQIEGMLTEKLGDTGKRLHTGRSRNDQVATDLHLLTRERVWGIAEEVQQLFDLLLQLSDQHQQTLLPGYTHLQVAMPSSFGNWFASYAECLVDDLRFLRAGYDTADQNPLGSGAGYGSSFPLDRDRTTELLQFSNLEVNVATAQLNRGKMEYMVSMGLACVATTLNKLAMDVCLYMNQDLGFIDFPDHLVTGSSIMPHKRNPDAFEAVRGVTNRVRSVPADIAQATTNLPSGYHRDLQVLKELFLPAFDDLRDCLAVTRAMLSEIRIQEDLLEQDKYELLFTVENVNQKVREGIPFRDAYQQVKEEVANGTFTPHRDLDHTMVGSSGNLQNGRIREKLEQVMKGWDYGKVKEGLKGLVG